MGQKIRLSFPAGVTTHQDSWARTWTADKYGIVEIDFAQGLVIDEFYAAGFLAVQPWTVNIEMLKAMKVPAGDGPYFLLELNRPVWRNSDNSGWIDAFGRAVVFSKPVKE